MVERIIWQFSNHEQALRTLKEYTQVGDRVDTTLGMAPNRTEPDDNGRGTKAIRMTITREVKETLLEWFGNILNPNVGLLDESMLMIGTSFEAYEADGKEVPEE